MKTVFIILAILFVVAATIALIINNIEMKRKIEKEIEKEFTDAGIPIDLSKPAAWDDYEKKDEDN